MCPMASRGGSSRHAAPYTLRGYYKSPAQNAQAIDKDGFYTTGDIVIRDARGNLRVVGRVKDQINRGGEKISAEEVENLLLRHPDVTQAALVGGVEDSALGEKSCAFICGTTGLRGPVLRRYLLAAGGIADYKLPDRFRFIDEMPLTAVGKIDKRRLRAQLAVTPPRDLALQP